MCASFDAPYERISAYTVAPRARAASMSSSTSTHAPSPTTEAGARRVERARRTRRMLFLGDEPAHRAEAREDQWVDARLGTAREHRVGVAALDQLGRLADGV